jgi:hypothetical protein
MALFMKIKVSGEFGKTPNPTQTQTQTPNPTQTQTQNPSPTQT